MGQTHSAPPQDALQFREMALAAYRGDAEALRRVFRWDLRALQLSRATYLDVCAQELALIDAETDSAKRERRRSSLEDEKRDVFAAVEQGRLVLGDTLLHVAARLGHAQVLDFLLLTDLPSPPAAAAASSARAPAPLPLLVPNFRGELPRDVAAKALPLQLALAGAADVHAVFGAAYREEPKVHRLARSLRRLWPRWMLEGQHEAAVLVRVLCDARSSDAAFAGLVRVALLSAERCRAALTLEGVRLAAAVLDAASGASGSLGRRGEDQARAEAERLLQRELSREDKLQLLDTWFARWFPSDAPDAHAPDVRGSPGGRRASSGAVATGRASDEYAAFFDAAAPVWLQLARSEPTLVAAAKALPPPRLEARGAADTDTDADGGADGGAAGEGEALDAALAGAAATLKRHELQLWKCRVRPPPAEMDALGSHISALEAFARLPHLKA